MKRCRDLRSDIPLRIWDKDVQGFNYVETVIAYFTCGYNVYNRNFNGVVNTACFGKRFVPAICGQLL